MYFRRKLSWPAPTYLYLNCKQKMFNLKAISIVLIARHFLQNLIHLSWSFLVLAVLFRTFEAKKIKVEEEVVI